MLSGWFLEGSKPKRMLDVVPFGSNHLAIVCRKNLKRLRENSLVSSSHYSMHIRQNISLELEYLRGVKYSEVKSLSRVWLFVTPWTVAYQASPSMAFSTQGYWNGLPFPSPEDLPNPGIKPGSPALQADTLPSEPPGKWSINITKCEEI